jgi:hypothetical protein
MCSDLLAYFRAAVWGDLPAAADAHMRHMCRVLGCVTCAHAGSAMPRSACCTPAGPTAAALAAHPQVRFKDRTVLNLDSSRQHCKLLLPDGTVAEVAVGKPAGLQQYVHPAMEFATWAFKSAAQRAAEIRAAALVQVGSCAWASCRLVSTGVSCLLWVLGLGCCSASWGGDG